MSVWTGAILVGGASRRMKRDKAFLEFEGRSFVERAIDTVRAAGGEPVLIARDDPDRFSSLGCRIETDRPGPGCALNAVRTALRVANRGIPAIVLAVDYPKATPEMLQLLRSRLEVAPTALVAAARHGEQVHPLFAAWHPKSVAILERSIECEELSLLGFLEHREWVAVDDLEPGALVNVNDPETLRSL